jgi:uncharacterized LabA/DUF88 family protein
MGQRTNVYIDGENHFHRSKACWKKLHGDDKELNAVFPCQPPVRGEIEILEAARFFYDPNLVFNLNLIVSGVEPDRVIYFTAFTGTDEELHRIRVELRNRGVEPQVVKEAKDLRDRRENRLRDASIVTKAKGVDIGMATRILEDAFLNNFDRCILLTSDIDFLPVVEVVKRSGKQVFVVGFRDGIGKLSPFEYVPDKFFDLSEFMQTHYALNLARRV